MIFNKCVGLYHFSRGRSARRDEDEEFTDETITKPTTKEIHKAIDTLVDFSMFT